GLDWFPGLGDGTFAPPQNLIGDPGDPMTDMKLADMDGDQDLDLVLCQGNWSPGFILLYLNDGTGGFSAPVDLFGGITDLKYYILVADLDGDGDQDIVSDEPLAQYVHMNDGTGMFGPPQNLFEGGYSGATYRTAVDVDLDGDLDITAAGLRVAINNGSGVMRMEKMLLYHPFAGTRTADMDGDGDMDIVTIMRDWFRNEDGVLDGCVAVNDTSNAGMDVVHDVDLDGDMDMVTLFGQDGNAYLQVLKNDGNGYFQPDTTYLITSFEGSHFAMGDLDQDGDLDAVLGPAQDEVAWFRNNGSMALTYAGPISDQYETVFTVQVLDVTGDGLLDVLV
ncbi:MAG TPA: VCBS repeat-containing protein, partial [Flavobacteriales bacterium]|nr:VCBS repeat-containing protein [Flavobacteriales bacterium]